MSGKLALEVLTGLEEEFPVQHWSAEGVEVWPAIRIWLGMRLLHQADSEEKRNPPAERPLVRRMGRSLRQAAAVTAAFARDYANNQPLDREYPVVVLMASGHRRVRLSKGWYAIYSDPFVDRYRSMGIDPLVLERGVNGYRMPRYSASSFVSPMPPWSSVVPRRRFVSRTPEATALDGYPEIRRLIEKEQGLSIPDPPWIRWLGRRIRHTADRWMTIFERVRPRVGFSVCYYNVDGFAFNMACSEFGIPSVDIQHGVQGSLHYAYGQWTKLPTAGYRLLPSYFWCWTAGDVDAIQAWSGHLDRHQALLGGNLWLDVWRERQDELEAGIGEEVAAVRRKGSVHVLYSCDRNPILPPALLGAIRDTPSGWVWWIRLHPGMDDLQRRQVFDQVRYAEDASVDVTMATRAPLPTLLSIVDVHVTRYSTVVLEAEAAGIPSVVLDPIGEEYYRRQIDSGSAYAADSREGLLSTLQDVLAATHGRSGGSTAMSGEHAGRLLRDLVEHGCVTGQTRAS